MAGRLSRPGATRERARRRPGRARVPLVVVRGASVPVPRVRSFRRRPATGEPACRDGTLPSAEIRTAEIAATEIAAGEISATESGARRAATEAPHVMRARPASLPAGVGGATRRDSYPREPWRPSDPWRSRLTGPGPPAELRSARACDVVAVAPVVTWPTAAPLAGPAVVPAAGLGLRSPAPSP